ncbi:hypothetical protein BJQ89_00758 [Arthrobacter sp. ES1]|nr:hypothetical protein [Arthrobacter sp. ES1]
MPLAEPYRPPVSPGDPSNPVPWERPSRLSLGARARGARATCRCAVWPPAIIARTGAKVSPVIRPAQARSQSAETTSWSLSTVSMPPATSESCRKK